MKKNLIKVLTFIFVLVFALILLPNTSAEESVTNEKVNKLFEEYYHDSVYTKNTVINLTSTAQEELIQHFHAQANQLVRTTYYSGDALWMSRGAEGEGVKYSYYGTHYTNGVADGVTNGVATTPLVAPENTSVVLKGEGKESMEAYYTTLYDLMNSNANWNVEGNVYSSTDLTMLKYFLDFTAPCLLDSVISSNYFAFSKVTVEEINNELVLKLWVSSLNYGAIVNGVENAENVLSQAVISAHNYSDWQQVKAPTLCEEGLKVRTCSCGDEIKEVLSAKADFRNDFSLESNNGNWQYGKVEYFWGESESFNFTPLTEKTGDAWVADGVEVKAGWINVNSMMGISYTATEGINISSVLEFFGATDKTALSVRIGIKNNEGVLYGNPTFDRLDVNQTKVVKTYYLNAGDTIYFIFGNENWEDGAYPNGQLDIKLTPAIEYRKEFNTEVSNGVWKYGSVDYNWGANDFTVIPAVNKNGGNDGWVAEGLEIKADWMFCGNLTAIGYTATEELYGKVVVRFNGELASTQVSLRTAVKNSEGVLYYSPTFNKIEHTGVLEFECHLNPGDTFYCIFGNEANFDEAKGHVEILIYNK